MKKRVKYYLSKGTYQKNVLFFLEYKMPEQILVVILCFWAQRNNVSMLLNYLPEFYANLDFFKKPQK